MRDDERATISFDAIATAQLFVSALQNLFSYTVFLHFYHQFFLEFPAAQLQ